MERQRFGRAAGILFFVSTASYLLGSGWIGDWLETPAGAGFVTDRGPAIAGSLLELVNAMAVIGISVLLFGTLKRHSESIAIGYLGSRIVEAALLAVGIVATLALIADGSSDEASLQTARGLAIAVRDASFQLAMVSLGAGSLAFCYLLYRARLIPRVLSGLGLLGYVALLTSSFLSLAGYEPGAYLFIPGGIFEAVFPLWLIVKGFPPERA
jgi:hypothetical protein